MDRQSKVSTVTSSSNLPLGVKGQRMLKFKTLSNGKNNKVYLLDMDRHTKLFMATLSFDLLLGFKVYITLLGSKVTQYGGETARTGSDLSFSSS